MKIGYQTIVSPTFTVEVIEQSQEKLVDEPKKTYEIQIGKENRIDLGKFVGNSPDIVFVNYDVKNISDQRLNGTLSVQGSYKSGRVHLKIDLKHLSQNLAGQNASGILTIMNKHDEIVQYIVGFNLTYP